MQITGFEAFRCPVRLPRTIRLGQIEIRNREFLVLRIRTDAGPTGYSVGYTRGTAVGEALVSLGPRIVKADPLMRRQIVDSLQRSNLPGQAALVRAISALDIALWDIAAKAAGLPLYRLLGGYRSRIPLEAVAGYFSDRRTAADIIREVRGLIDAGFRAIKLCLPGENPRADFNLVSRLAKAVGGSVKLAVDAHWSWRTIPQALHTCRLLDDLGLAFIEDPFCPQEWRLTRELQRHLRTPLAAGEDVASLAGFRDMIEAVLVLLVDATASGGITGALAAIDLAAASGRTVLPHTFLPLHGHLAGSRPEIEFAEVIADSSVDPWHRFLFRQPHVADGHLHLREEPGNGWLVDWDAAAALAVQTYSA